MFDVIVPVYNSMHHVRACIASIYTHATLPFHLYIIDDGSDEYTKQEIAQLLNSYPEQSYTLVCNPSNLGYLKNCNKGISLGNNPYVILLNSDAMFTSGCLERVKNAFDSDKSIAVVSAVSTWANWTRIPFPNGFTIHQLTKEISRFSSNTLIDIKNASGFFFAVPRSIFETLGTFDEIFHPGYYEETDFCMRAIKAGYRVVVDDGLYIFHYGWGSFEETGRNENMKRNREVFLSKWTTEFQEIESQWKRENPLQSLIEHLSTPQIGMIKHRNVNQPEANISQNAQFMHKNPLLNKKILYVLPSIKLYGGVVSVLQIVNNLVLAGIDANIVTYGEIDEKIYQLFPLYFRPYVFSNMDEMIDSFPECELVVATHWSTVSPITQILAIKQSTKAAYFVQDFEPYFYESDSEQYRLAERTYSIIKHQIVKTNWLAEMLAPYGGEVKIIPLGLNLDYFHALPRKRKQQIIAMARPSSQRRNFTMLKQVYEELNKRRPEIGLAVYGIGHNVEDFECPVVDYGTLEDFKSVSETLSESLVLLDPSTFQGFGRPGLEAMACGAVAVLTDTGGITQYAKHRFNCLLIDPNDCENIVSSLIEVFDDINLRSKLTTNGLSTAKRYSDKAEVNSTIEFFGALLD